MLKSVIFSLLNLVLPVFAFAKEPGTAPIVVDPFLMLFLISGFWVGAYLISKRYKNNKNTPSASNEVKEDVK